MGFVPADGPGTQNLYGTPAYPDYDADGDDRVAFSRETLTARRRELLVEQASETGGPIRLGDRVEPAREERLALGVDEDVRPPQRVLDELEALLRLGPRDSGRRRGR